VDDADFMDVFGRRHAVLHAPGAEKLWERGARKFHFIANYNEPARHRDVNAVTPSTVAWTYVPLLYYMISRFRREGLGTPLFRELVPAILAAYLFTSVGALSLVLVPASWLMFYCVYEIGGLVNDLHTGRETPGHGTRRISPGVRIHVGLFVAIRAIVIALLLVWLPIRGYTARIYLGALGLCLAVYLVHTFLPGFLRVISFTLLKLCRNVVPLLVLAPYTPLATLIWLCTIFFLVDAPWRVWAYCRARRLIEDGPSVWRVRCAVLALLWGLGAVVYILDGSLLLLAVASYHVVIECLWWIRATLSLSAADYRDLVA